MTNFVSNRLKPIKEADYEKLRKALVRPLTKAEIKELQDEGYSENYIKECGERVDFNLVIDVPKDLYIEAGGSEWISKKYSHIYKDMYKKQESEIRPRLDKIFDKNLSQDEFAFKFEMELKPLIGSRMADIYGIGRTNAQYLDKALDNIVRGYYNERKYGETNWYTYCIKVWGTKWNASSCNIVDSIHEIDFNTAYDAPEPVYKELSKKVPFVVAFAEDDMGANYGIYVYNKGKVQKAVECSKDKSWAVRVAEAYAVDGYQFESIEEDYCEDNYTDEEIQEIFEMDRGTFFRIARQAHDNVKVVLDRYYL